MKLKDLLNPSGCGRIKRMEDFILFMGLLMRIIQNYNTEEYVIMGLLHWATKGTSL